MRTDHPTDRGAGPASGPVRTCIGCRRRDFRTALVRLALSPHLPAVAMVDEKRGATGRGAWIHPVIACLDLAQQRKAARRAFRATREVHLELVREWMNTHEGEDSDA